MACTLGLAMLSVDQKSDTLMDKYAAPESNQAGMPGMQRPPGVALQEGQEQPAMTGEKVPVVADEAPDTPAQAAE